MWVLSVKSFPSNYNSEFVAGSVFCGDRKLEELLMNWELWMLPRGRW